MSDKNRISVLSTSLSQCSPYYIGEEITDQFCDILSEHSFDKIFFVTNALLFDMYADEYLEAFEKNGFTYELIQIPDGESNKTFGTLENLCETFINKQISKDSIIIAFGGGMLSNVVAQPEIGNSGK